MMAGVENGYAKLEVEAKKRIAAALARMVMSKDAYLKAASVRPRELWHVRA